MSRTYEFNLLERGTLNDENQGTFYRVVRYANTDVEALQRVRNEFSEERFALVIGFLPDGRPILSQGQA